VAIPVFVEIYTVVISRGGFYPSVLLAYLGLSVLAFIVYALDKSAAVSGRWRTPESTMHLISLAGGWPGALIAQQLLRHKTSKQSFVYAFWFAVLINVSVFVAWHAGLSPLRPPKGIAKSVGPNENKRLL
jgi:uncharacterized membrane protein YsdA (DUF1294 family)